MNGFSKIHSPMCQVIGGLTCILSLGGCLVGPDYQRPEIEVPTDWKSLDTPGAESGPHVVTEILPEAEWWKAFENEELSGFIEQALRKNHNVREAAFRVMEGRANILSAGASLYPQLGCECFGATGSSFRNTFPRGDREWEPRSWVLRGLILAWAGLPWI